MNRACRVSTAARPWRRAALRFIGVLIATALAIPAAAGEITVGVVRDGPGPEDRLVGLIEQELADHTPRGTTVRFKSHESFGAAWDQANAATALGNALSDPEVDYVLAVGSLVTHAAARSATPLTKPVVSSFVQRADVFKLPYTEDGQSMMDNLSFIVVPQRAAGDVRAFRELAPFQVLHVAVTPEDLNDVGELAEGLERFESELGIRIELVPVSTKIDEAFPDLKSARAVYLTRLQRLDQPRRRQLIEGLNELDIPTFSMLGHSDVELGALAGVTPDIEQQVVRRVALNLGKLMRGKPSRELPVLLSVDSRLLINARTASEIGYSPRRETGIFAQFLHPEALETETETESLDFATLIASAESGNTSLQVADSAVEGVRRDQLRAKSALLPQLRANLSYNRADTDFTPVENGTFGSLTLRQQIYDDDAWSTYRSSARNFEGAQRDREVERLEVLSAAGQAFYDLALAQAQYRIVAGDLRLTEDNLELAKLRREVGYSGREEVLRWEAVLADRRASLFRASQNTETARIGVNQVLGLSQERRWTPQEPVIDPEVFPVLGGRLDPVFESYATRDRVRGALVEIALQNAPELGALDKTIEAQDIQTRQLKRRYVVPRFFVDATYSEQFNDPDGLLFPEEESYSISVNAAYPLFEGGRRRHDLERARTDTETLSRQRRLIEERVEQRTRVAAQRCENSFPRIKFALQAARAAGESLELVRDQYAQGVVNVTDLLDAQNQKLTVDQLANSAVYEFMGDLVELQRAIAWFELDHTPEERDAFVARVLAAVTGEQP